MRYFILFILSFAIFATNAVSAQMSSDATSSTDIEAPLNLDALPISTTDIVPVQSDSDTFLTFGPILLIAVMLLFIGVAVVCGRRAAPQTRVWQLQQAPLAAKLTWTFVLVIYAMVHVLAAITVYLDTRVVYNSVAEYFHYLKPARLTALSHAHLMAITTMDALVVMLFSFSRTTSGFVTGLVTATFVGIVGDIGSWWLIKYYGEKYETVSMVSGSLFTGGFTIMLCILLYDTWLRQPQDQEKQC